MNAKSVADEILHEREVQIGRWGNEADDARSLEHWGNILGAYVGRVQTAIQSRCEKPTDEASLRYTEVEDGVMRQDAIKVATICMAFVETLDRKNKSE